MAWRFLVRRIRNEVGPETLIIIISAYHGER